MYEASIIPGGLIQRSLWSGSGERWYITAAAAPPSQTVITVIIWSMNKDPYWNITVFYTEKNILHTACDITPHYRGGYIPPRLPPPPPPPTPAKPSSTTTTITTCQYFCCFCNYKHHHQHHLITAVASSATGAATTTTNTAPPPPPPPPPPPRHTAAAAAAAIASSNGDRAGRVTAGGPLPPVSGLRLGQ